MADCLKSKQTLFPNSRVFTRFSNQYDLVDIGPDPKWPTLEMKQAIIQINFQKVWVENVAPKVFKKFFLWFDLVTWFMTSVDPCKKALKTSTNLHDDLMKIWPLKCSQCFSFFGPGDLLSDHNWPIYKKSLEGIKTNILTKSQCEQMTDGHQSDHNSSTFSTLCSGELTSLNKFYAIQGQ